MNSRVHRTPSKKTSSINIYILVLFCLWSFIMKVETSTLHSINPHPNCACLELELACIKKTHPHKKKEINYNIIRLNEIIALFFPLYKNATMFKDYIVKLVYLFFGTHFLFCYAFLLFHTVSSSIIMQKRKLHLLAIFRSY